METFERRELMAADLAMTAQVAVAEPAAEPVAGHIAGHVVVPAPTAPNISLKQGTLTVEGTDGRDLVDINYHYPSLISVNVRDAVGNVTASRYYYRSTVSKIHVDTHGGDDVVTNNTYIKDEIWAGSGNDMITAGNADSIVHGEDGGDIILGRNGNDRLYGWSGSDQIRGGAGNDVVWGGAGSDHVFGDSGRDSLRGGDQNDRLYGGTGDDVIDGDNGSDLSHATASTA